MKKIGFFLMVAAFVGLVSCEEDATYENGSYKAETEDYSHGWKTFMEASINGDELTVVNFDAADSTGNLKSETTAETYPMNPHPTVWIPELEAQYMAVDILNYEAVDGITGATSASVSAAALFELILDAAKDGDSSTQILPTE